MYCDYCSCDNCKFGASWLEHALTKDNDYICSTCYEYDLCISGPNRNENGPCEDENCEHRPRIISKWH